MVPERFPYSKQAFLSNLILLAAFATVVLIFLLITPVDTIIGTTVLLLVSITVLVLGISPFLTSHELRGDVLILRQGWYFKAEVPLDNIREVSRLENGPRKVGVTFGVVRPTVRVTTRRKGVFEIRLRQPQKFMWALGKKADRVVFDAMDNCLFERLISRTTLSSPGPRSAPPAWE